jgi:hypothetical protein
VGSSLPAGSSETLQSLPQCRENSTVARVSSPYRPEGKRDRASCRSSAGGRRLCRAHKSWVTGRARPHGRRDFFNRGEPIAALAGAGWLKRSCRRSSPTTAIPGVGRRETTDIAARRCRQGNHAQGRRDDERERPMPDRRCLPVCAGRPRFRVVALLSFTRSTSVVRARVIAKPAVIGAKLARALGIQRLRRASSELRLRFGQSSSAINDAACLAAPRLGGR